MQNLESSAWDYIYMSEIQKGLSINSYCWRLRYSLSAQRSLTCLKFKQDYSLEHHRPFLKSKLTIWNWPEMKRLFFLLYSANVMSSLWIFNYLCLWKNYIREMPVKTEWDTTWHLSAWQKISRHCDAKCWWADMGSHAPWMGRRTQQWSSDTAWQ